jgi:hypothetical protein
MRVIRVIALLGRALMIGALPVGAIIWLAASAWSGIVTTIALAIAGAIMFVLTPPLRDTRPFRGPGAPEQMRGLGTSRGAVKEQQLRMRPDNQDPSDYRGPR